MSKKDVQINRWFYEIPDLIPDSEGKTAIVKIKSFGPLEVFEWGIGSDGVPYELYNWCENDLCEHENYCRPTTAETLWKKIKEVITLFERNGCIKQADIYRGVLDKVRQLPRETALDTYNEE